MESGKKKIAIDFAKHILSDDEKSFNIDNHPDFCIVLPDGNSIKIEQIRMVQNKITEKPIISDKKVYIIDDSELMTKEAQNCLLKTLEEPPEYATIILICSNENMLLSTIKSRCMKLYFESISNEEIKEYLAKAYDNLDVSDSVLEIANGSIGKVCQNIEKQQIFESIKPIFENLDKYDLIDFIKKSEYLYKAKDDIFNILEYANIILFDKLKKDNRYLNCTKYVEIAKNRLMQNANYEMTIDDLLFHLWEEINENNNRS